MDIYRWIINEDILNRKYFKIPYNGYWWIVNADFAWWRYIATKYFNLNPDKLGIQIIPTENVTNNHICGFVIVITLSDNVTTIKLYYRKSNKYNAYMLYCREVVLYD